MIILCVLRELGEVSIDNQTVEVYNNKSEEYLKLVERPASKSLLDFIAVMKEQGLVLDLGCGPGKASALMQKSGLRVDPIDASSEMVKLANNLYELKARRADFSDVHGKDIYDGVWANFSLLHVRKREFELHIKALFRILKPNGFFNIGMKLGKGEKRDPIGRFYAYYTEIELKEILVNAGLHICETYYGEEMGLVGSIEPWIMLRLTK